MSPLLPFKTTIYTNKHGNVEIYVFIYVVWVNIGVKVNIRSPFPANRAWTNTYNCTNTTTQLFCILKHLHYFVSRTNTSAPLSERACVRVWLSP